MRSQATLRTIAAVVAFAAGTAHAGQHRSTREATPETVTGQIPIDAAQLVTARGRAVVRARIRGEAARLCDGPGGSPLAVTTNPEACQRAVIRSAERALARQLRAAAPTQHSASAR